MTIRSTFIINPASGRYSAAGIRHIVALLAARGHAPEVLLTQGPDDAERLARMACDRHPEGLIVAGGGDGTVNGVINGIVPGTVMLGILPLGTANVLAKEAGILTVEDAVERIVRGETRSLSVGRVKGDGFDRLFALMAGIGLDGEIVRTVRLSEKKLLRQGAYLLSALRCLRSWERKELEVVADGNLTSCHSVVVCNGASYGGSFRLAPQASVFSPGLHAVCVTGRARLSFLLAAAAMALVRRGSAVGVQRLSASTVTVSGRKPVQVDGDFCGYSPVEVQSVPDFARMIC